MLGVTARLGPVFSIKTALLHHVLGKNWIIPGVSPLLFTTGKRRRRFSRGDMWSQLSYLSNGCHAIISWKVYEESIK